MNDVLGVVPVVGRGPLVHGSLGGVSLLDLAVELMADVCSSVIVVRGADQDAQTSTHPGIESLLLPVEDQTLRRRLEIAEQVVIHDPLCPLVSDRFVRGLLADAGSRTLVAVRPVVDTIKATEDAVISGTVDRDGLRVISSPVVLPANVLADLPDLAALLADLTTLVTALRRSGPVEFVTAPSAARRVEDPSGLRLVTSLDAVSHRTRERN